MARNIGVARALLWWASAAALAWSVGCSGGGSAGPSAPGPAAPANALAQFATCDELRGAIVEDGRSKISLQAERLRRDGYFVVRDDNVSGPTPAPGIPPPSEFAPDDFTDTNVQVPGVDEADFIETDGANLYLLQGEELVTLDSFPPEATALRSQLVIEGSPAGMFVADGRAVVLSHVYDAGELGGDDACRYFGSPLPTPLVGAPASDVFVPCGASFTKVTLVDLSGAEPQVTREIFLEGAYAAARRHGSRVRVVVQRGWGLPPGVPEPWTTIWSPAPPASQAELAERVDAWEAQALAAIEESALDEWLPAMRERVDGDLVDLPASCSDVHVPAPRLAGDGATRIFALDMSQDDAPVRDTVVLGGALQAYANVDTLVLSQPDWSWYDAGESTDRTALHVFAIPADSLETIYRASGFVPGTPHSQFSVDVRGGIVRVATTVAARELDDPELPPTSSRVTTARVEGDELVAVGSSGDLAPGERIFAARFLGDRVYLVTFRQIDPLFVIDLADPAAPTVLGEVELPGFSEYIHPLGDAHLLTVGRDADADGRTRGVALRIFDVSNPTAPALSHVELLPGEGWSPAESDHLAFTFDTRTGLLALPYTRYDAEYRSSLVVIGVDEASGFTPRGEIDHDGLVTLPCPIRPDEPGGCSSFADMRRGLFIEDWVYSVSTAGVQVHGLEDLATPLAEVRLPDSIGSGPGPEPLPAQE
jgi:hypothetical protein